MIAQGSRLFSSILRFQAFVLLFALVGGSALAASSSRDRASIKNCTDNCGRLAKKCHDEFIRCTQLPNNGRGAHCEGNLKICAVNADDCVKNCDQ